MASLLSAAPATAQVRVGVGVRVGAPRGAVRGYYYRPYRIYAPYYYGYYGSYYWYPGFYGYWGYPQYPYYGGRYLDDASLRLDVKPRQTQVYIDGYYAGTVDDFDGFFQRLHLEPGEHDLALYLPGYRVERRQVYLQPDRTFRVRFAMMPLAPGDPEPEKPAPPPSTGSAPPPIPPGNRVQGPPAPREPATRQAGYAALAVRVQPADAEITIDGERWESSGNDQLLVQLSAGAHHVEARKGGYRLYATDVTVRPGETATLNVALSREP